MFSPLTTFRHSAIRRLHASWQSRGTVAASLPATPECDEGECEALRAGVAVASLAGRRLQAITGSNFSFGNFVDAIAPFRSRFHRIVLRHPLSEQQKSATRSLICGSEIFAATRYIPD